MAELKWTLDNPNGYGTSATDNFGGSVATDGDYAIVGAFQEDDASGTSSGKAYIFNIITGSLLWTLDNPNPYGTSANDYFGIEVDISGNYCIVSAVNEDEASNLSSGKAYIFNVTTGELVHTLNNPNNEGVSEYDFFGKDVAIDGNNAIVGASGEIQGTSNSSGKVYVFNVTTGGLIRTLTNPNGYDTADGDQFGSSVELDGINAIVGATGEDDAGGNSSGKAYIIDITDGSLLQTLDNPNGYNTSANDNFGFSVAIDNNYAIVGAYLEDDAGGTSSGKAYIFNVTTGSLIHTLDNPNAYSTSADDYFAEEVSINGNYCVAGAFQEDDADGSAQGKTYIFNVITGDLFLTLDNPNDYDSPNDKFGSSVGLNKNYLIVGASAESDSGGVFSGKAYIFDFIDIFLTNIIDNPNTYGTSADDQFGFSVSTCNSYAIVGAYLEDDAGGTTSGKAYIFDPSDGSLLWTLNNPNAYNTSAGDNFTSEVSIIESYAIVGAYLEDDAGGTSSGKAYIFDPSDGSLLWTLDNPSDYGTSQNDNFGYSVSINESRAVVGAYGEDDTGGTTSGKAYIFDPSDGSLLLTLDNPNAYNTSTGDNFGYSVSVSNTSLIIGAYLEDDGSFTECGKAYIYGFNTTYIDIASINSIVNASSLQSTILSVLGAPTLTAIIENTDDARLDW